ncbi:MAG: outer membrane lipoprotein-sorting protein [Acidobacteriota bacterium]|nr:outer membrane lipoprotein-sorting protein [Acidobacteriota bacterium]
MSSVLKSILLVAIGFVLASAAFAEEDHGQVSEQALLVRYAIATQAQQSTMRGATMEVDIDASVPKLNKNGRLHALRNISNLGKITYHMLGFNGDGAIKKEVIARYLSADAQAQEGPNLSITPENYKFKYKGLQSDNGSAVYVFQLSPRKKRVGLFKGDLWLDPKTAMPVRESGRFVKTPSIFLKKMQFVRTYELQNGVSIPQRVESLVDTRLFGRVQMNINFTHFCKDPGAEQTVAATF